MACLSRSGEQYPSELIVDRISSLPREILDIILGKLSTLDAIKMSVLAKEWRFKWLSVSVFDLNALIFNHLGVMTREVKWDEVCSIINTYLRHHTSPIKSFSLISELSLHHSDMYEWIEYLSKQPVEVLSLEDCCVRKEFEMSPHMFSFENLKFLSLLNCGIQIPHAFGRFRFLYEIVFEDVSINDDDLERLILACPILEKMTLLDIFELEHLKIHAPNLAELMIDTKIEDITIGDQCLAVVHITSYSRGPEGLVEINWQNVNHCLSGLHCLQSLTLSGDFIKLWALHDDPEYFPVRNNTVMFVSLDGIRFENIGVFVACLSLLSTCPMVKHFSFHIESAKGPQLIASIWNSKQGQFSFPKLEVLEMICPVNVGMGCSVNFLEFVSAHSPNLKRISIHRERAMEINSSWVSNIFSWVSNMLLRLKYCCPHAVVEYRQPGCYLYV